MDALQKARERFMAADYKKAVSLLWEVTPDDGTKARAVLDLTAAMHDKLTGSLQSQCDSLASRARVALEAGDAEASAERLDALRAELANDPAELARRAAEAGLRWLKIETEADEITAAQEAAMCGWARGSQAERPKPCLIDLVEAKGWKLEQAQDLFVPTTLNSIAIRGLDERIAGQTRHIYLFRRSAPAAAERPTR